MFFDSFLTTSDLDVLKHYVTNVFYKFCCLQLPKNAVRGVPSLDLHCFLAYWYETDSLSTAIQSLLARSNGLSDRVPEDVLQASKFVQRISIPVVELDLKLFVKQKQRKCHLSVF